jgi:hypothetical protein
MLIKAHSERFVKAIGTPIFPVLSFTSETTAIKRPFYHD